MYLFETRKIAAVVSLYFAFFATFCFIKGAGECDEFLLIRAIRAIRGSYFGPSFHPSILPFFHSAYGFASPATRITESNAGFGWQFRSNNNG